MLLGDYPRYMQGKTVIVAASGAGLTWEVAHYLLYKRDWPIIAVNDAVHRLPFAHSLYAADGAWWREHRGVPSFGGLRWSVLDLLEGYRPEKMKLADQYGIRLLLPKVQEHFSHDPQVLTTGSNSGFQAINLALHFGASRIVLVGFNMRGDHFFGKHPLPLRNTDPERFIPFFDAAAGSQGDVEILNATPGSALKCFKQVNLESLECYTSPLT